ncbi:integrase [Dysgonomonas sp. PH5-45]|uniref:tyrosine-type recombinase/integrase n=1 Tax=unclassified Dysgonomonas TaxID=2630389 RepID=UPI0024730B5D|nr:MULTISPECIES: site-specific integrase [unclassified Dysgonomonas]MDH6355494.1 integrase [Dysgonomonas sp. PH5-45]MDH6388390.1 integrase [Dysgonomonas sp. PH5-37]
MGRRKIKFSFPRLNDCKGDMSKDWYVEYSYRDERTGILERFRKYDGFKALSSEKERREYARAIIDRISEQLSSGWNPVEPDRPVYDDKLTYNIHARVYGSRTESDKNLLYYINLYLSEKTPFLRYKTLQDYTSKLRLFYQWLYKNKMKDIHAFEVTNDMVASYVIYMATELKREGRTIKDSKQRINGFFNWLVKKKIILQNPIFDLPEARQHKDHSAQPMTQKEASFLLNYIKEQDPQTYLFCAMIFYCAIRPGTELRLLKIKDINLFSQTIRIRVENGKTGEGIINIPPALVKILEDMNIMANDREFYVFGKEGKPGTECWGKNHFRCEFNKHRDAIGYPKEYKLYSWKCTGAVLFAMSGAPIPAIRDHCRHKSTAYTDIYLSKKIGKQNDYVKHNFPEL